MQSDRGQCGIWVVNWLRWVKAPWDNERGVGTPTSGWGATSQRLSYLITKEKAKIAELYY